MQFRQLRVGDLFTICLVQVIELLALTNRSLRRQVLDEIHCVVALVELLRAEVGIVILVPELHIDPLSGVKSSECRMNVPVVLAKELSRLEKLQRWLSLKHLSHQLVPVQLLLMLLLLRLQPLLLVLIELSCELEVSRLC